jgi:hypothetical protein
MIPQFANAGSLLLGLTGLITPQTLRLHARFGAADARAHDAPDVSWEYLQGDRWLRMATPHAEADTTEGLRTSGTISLSIPAIAPEPGTTLGMECQWLRAAVRERADAFPALTRLMLHAVRAVRRVEEPGADLDTPLPPHRITNLLRPLKGIRGASQPGASFGGRAPESDRAFQTRVSERLRHKGRAVVGWDYERLVLERFPMISQARTLPARRRKVGESGVGPGHVRVVVVAGPSCPEVDDPAAPLASRDRLAGIESALRAVAAPGLVIHVSNPAFVRVRVTATVQWREGLDPREGAERLGAGLDAYLSPWQDGIREPSDWSEAAIAQFVRTRAEVAALLSIAFQYIPDDDRTTDPDLVMVVSAGRHVIDAGVPAEMATADGY